MVVAHGAIISTPTRTTGIHHQVICYYCEKLKKKTQRTLKSYMLCICVFIFDDINKDRYLQQGSL